MARDEKRAHEAHQVDLFTKFHGQALTSLKAQGFENPSQEQIDEQIDHLHAKHENLTKGTPMPAPAAPKTAKINIPFIGEREVPVGPAPVNRKDEAAKTKTAAAQAKANADYERERDKWQARYDSGYKFHYAAMTKSGAKFENASHEDTHAEADKRAKAFAGTEPKKPGE